MHCILCGNPACGVFARVEDRVYHRCPTCDLTFLHPSLMLPLAEQKVHYDLHENDPRDPGYRMFLSRLMQPLLPKLQRGAYGLDYGCGPGPALAGMLGERGFCMEVYDPIYADDEDVLEERYDFVTCTEVVEHLQDPAAVFELFDRVLLPGGWLGIMTSWLSDEIDFARWHYRRDPTHVCFYTTQTFEWIAARSGWQVEFPVENVALMRKLTHAEDKIMGQRAPFRSRTGRC